MFNKEVDMGYTIYDERREDDSFDDDAWISNGDALYECS